MTLDRVHIASSLTDELRVDGLRLAAAASAVAGFIHLWEVAEHLRASLLVGGFFLLVGCAQVILAAVLVAERPGTQGLIAVAVAHVALVALYVATRTQDLPLAPVHAAGAHVDADAVAAAAPGGIGNGVPIYPGSQIEPVGPLDLVAVLAEVLLVALLMGRLSSRARAGVLNAALVLGLSVWVLRLTA